MAQSLQSFIEEEEEKILAFKKYWMRNHEKNPEQFPLTLPDGNEGLWQEMYIEFDPNDPKNI